MEYKGTLLERLMSKYDRSSNQEVVAASILNYIDIILNTKKGTVASIPEFGIDLQGNPISTQYDIGVRISKDIENQISKFDPRVQKVSVAYKGTDSNRLNKMIFEVNALIRIDDEEFTISSSLSR